MWKIVAVCAALLAFSAPALAQDAPPSDQTPGFTPGTVILGAAGLGLAIWAIAAASKKTSNPVSP